MYIVQLLQANAEFEGKTIQLHLRVAWSEKKDAIYYDLTDEKRRCIKITKKDGWQLTNNQIEVLFARYNQTPQVEPSKDYDEKILDKFINSLNIKNEKHKLLIKIWIVTLFIPQISHPILLPHGEKGSAKSTFQKKVKILVNPSEPELLSIHYDKTEFIQQLSHNYLEFYDNVKYEPKWLSDEACKAVTGIGFTKRKLYTNDEDQIYKYKRCLSFSGINVIFREPDVLDRSIKIELERIDDEHRIPEERIYTELIQQLPQMLGYIFDTLSKAISIKDTITLEKLPRMADFAEWSEAISRAMGYRPLEFLEVYYENIGEQNLDVIESDSFGDTIVKFLDYDTRSWISAPKFLIEKIKEYAESNGVDTSKFPKQPNSLTVRLKRIKSNLRDGLGIEVIIERITSGKGNKKCLNTTLIKIRKISPISPISPVNENDEGNEDDNNGDTEIIGDNNSNDNKTSPVDKDQNCAQIASDLDKIGDTGGNGDNLGDYKDDSQTTPNFFSYDYLDEDLKLKI